MSASSLMVVAIVLAAIGRWAHSQPLGTAKTVVEVAFAVLVVALLDHGQTEAVAKGFGWLFLVAVLLSNNSPLTGLAKIVNTKGN
jgi:uncharacterized membrane protein YbjE (DUF340 family)